MQCLKSFFVNNLAILSLPLCLQSFGAVEVAYQKKIALISENNFQIGGNLSGKQLQSSHQKELFLIIMLIVQKILMVELILVSSLNGLKHLNQLILIHLEEMSWETSLFQQKKL